LSGDDTAALLEWFEPRRRMYPWRGSRDPYHVLVSEVMLQQTQVARVVPAYRAFLRRFPSIRSLAAATRGEVLQVWAGLGYNRRALRLSEAARAIVRIHRGRIPSSPEDLRKLPGVGPYTAAAVASLGFGRPVPAIDTNAARVVARARLGFEAHEVRRGELEQAATAWLDPADPRAWNQALMDLGRQVCRPVPRCPACPLARGCLFRLAGRPAAPTMRPHPPFKGSMREVRGAVVRVLRDRSSASIGVLARQTRQSVARMTQAVRALATDGLVEASAAAMAGWPAGRVRLPRG
jgi:A/G-specific adenine glycosylase